MTEKTAAAKKPNPNTLPKNVTKFYVEKRRLAPIINSIAAMQQLDSSGKFARKLAQIMRVLRQHAEAVNDEVKALQEQHKAKFPDGHPQAGETKPVYKVDAAGNFVFKLDDAGNKTEEREVMPGEWTFADPVKYQEDYREMERELVEIECPAFCTTDPDGKAGDNYVPELDRWAKIKGTAIDGALDLEEGAATTQPPKGRPVYGIVIEGDVDRPALAIVKDEPPTDTTADSADDAGTP